MSASDANSEPLAVDCAHVSDIGMRRTTNQDALAVELAKDGAAWHQRGHLLIVADGMGAHAAGELASHMAVENVARHYKKLIDLSPPAALRQAIREANDAIYQKGQSAIDCQGMGTTCTCMAILPQGVLVAHVGDSRAYRLRGALLEQLSFDHSLVWEMAAAGQTLAEDLPSFIPKNVITRSLGPRTGVHVDLEGPFSVQEGDAFLLCSDGLSGQVTDEELGTILRCLSPQEAAQTLVDMALIRGGPDNISLVVLRIEGEPPATAAGPTEPEIIAQSAGLRRPRPREVLPHPLPLVAIAAFLALFLWCYTQDLTLGAVLSAVGLGAAAAIALVQRWLVGPRVSDGSIGGPYGNGPYRTYACSPNPGVVDAFKELVTELQSIADRETWPIDWSPLRMHTQAARAAYAQGDWDEAVREYAAAIRAAMKKLREHDWRPED